NFDVVADFIAYVPEQIEQDVELFLGRTRQYVFISSASAYEKPPRSYLVTEETLLENPFWEYSRNKIACEVAVRRAARERGLPATIVRPSYTYCPSKVPGHSGLCFHHFERIRRGQPL